MLSRFYFLGLVIGLTERGRGMVRNRKPSGTAASLPAGIGIGVVIAVALTVAGTSLVAWMLNSGNMTEAGVGYSAMVILLVSAAVGSWFAEMLVKHRYLVVGLSTGAAYFVLLLGLTAFFFGGQYQGVVPTGLLILGGSAAAVLVGNRSGGNRTPRRHKTRTG